ncbi:MAG: DNA topoisomerase-3 [Mariniblastus sp.]|jgi:DNA topoisomerase-3
MSKTLIIAEKPSVATDLARVLGKLPELGKFEKKKDFFENDNAFVASAVGHLVALKMPTKEDGKKLPWSMAHLPHIPKRFELEPIDRSLAKFKLLVRLLKKKEVTTVVNACDAGREGELIFRYLMDMADLKKDLTIKRMWMQSMTDGAILEAWGNMRNGEELDNLADAAVCRSQSDWLIGLNGTRALTAFNSRNGGFNVTSAGRVQTPTLVILAEKERVIRSFVSRPYYDLNADFKVSHGEYGSKWFREDFEKDENDNQLKADRIWSLAEAEAIKARCEGKEGRVEENKKPAKQAPPLLFDLTSLQREAGNKFGFSAQRTLQLAQSLYDRYKLLTYPRTDSKYLPEDYIDTVKGTVLGFSQAKTGPCLNETLISCSKWIMDNNKIGPTKRIFNTKKVSDHFAIIPTGKIPPAKVDDAAAKLYQLVMQRFLGIFFPHAEFEVTKRITRIDQDSFLTAGRILVVPGYLEVYGRKPGAAADKDELVFVADGELANNVNTVLLANETKPPARFNDSTLLSAMETAGKRVDDDELREAMSERGLGTPATRAAIIENLIRQKYVFRHELNKRELVVSNKGMALVDLLDEIGISTLGSPEMTGEWEHKLKEMEAGRLSKDVFMQEIADLTIGIVNQTKEFTDEKVNRVFPDLHAPCPECNGQIHKQTDGVFECMNPECKFRLKKHIASHELTEAQARELIINKKIGPFADFKNRFGQPFEAELTIAKEKKTWKVSFVFEGDDRREEELKSLTDEMIICEAKLKDNSDELIPIYETENAFLAPAMALKADDRGVRISKTILKREIPTDQAIKLFAEGKTDLMPGFLSKKGRKFAAHLTIDREKGKLGFEFAPRKNAKKTEDAGTEEGDGKVKTVKKSTKKKTTKKKAVKKKTTKKKATKKKAAKKKTTKKKAAGDDSPAANEDS